MKKFITILLALIMCVSLALVATACNDGEPEHTHTYASEWTSDDTHHWKKATCEHTSEVSEKAEHAWGTDRKCSVCSKEKPVSTYTLQDRLNILAEDIEANPNKFALTLSVEVDISAMFQQEAGSVFMSMVSTEYYSDGVLKSVSSEIVPDFMENTTTILCLDGFEYKLGNDDAWKLNGYDANSVSIVLEDRIDGYLAEYDFTSKGIIELLKSATVSGDTATLALKENVTATATLVDGVATISGLKVDMSDYFGAEMFGDASLKLEAIGTQTVDVPAELNTYIEGIEEIKTLVKLDRTLGSKTGKVSVKETKTGSADVEYDVLINNGEVQSKHPENPYFVKKVSEDVAFKFVDGQPTTEESYYRGFSVVYDYNFGINQLYNIDHDNYVKDMYNVDANNANKAILDTTNLHAPELVSSLTIEAVAPNKVKVVVEFETGHVSGLDKVEFNFDFTVTPTIEFSNEVNAAAQFVDGEIFYKKLSENTVQALYIFNEQNSSGGGSQAQQRHIIIPETVTINSVTYTVTQTAGYYSYVKSLYLPDSITDFNGLSANEYKIYFLGTFEQLQSATDSDNLLSGSGCANGVYVYSENEPVSPVPGVNYWHWNSDQTQAITWEFN